MTIHHRNIERIIGGCFQQVVIHELLKRMIAFYLSVFHFFLNIIVESYLDEGNDVIIFTRIEIHDKNKIVLEVRER